MRVVLAVFLCFVGVFWAVADPGLSRYIRQIQLSEAGQPSVDMTVAPTGSSNSSWPVTGLTTFQLWALRDVPREWVLVDSKTVDKYGAIVASITIQSLDVVNPLRTRADKNYTLTRSVADLASMPFNGNETGDLFAAWNYEQQVGGVWQNRDGPRNIAPVTNETLTRTPLLMEHGFEFYYVDAMAVYDAVAYRLATASVEVFPVATLTFTGINHGEVLRGDPAGYPRLNVNAASLYPDNITSVRLTGPDGVTELAASTNQVSLVSAVDLSSRVTQAGNYSVSVFEYTPLGAVGGGWGLELLGQLDFSVVFGEQINANIHSK